MIHSVGSGSGTQEPAPDTGSDPFGSGSGTQEPAPADDPVTLPEMSEEPATPDSDPFGEVPSEEEPGGLAPIDDSGMEAAPRQQQPTPIVEEPIEVTPIPGTGAPINVWPRAHQHGQRWHVSKRNQ